MDCSDIIPISEWPVVSNCSTERKHEEQPSSIRPSLGPNTTNSGVSSNKLKSSTYEIFYSVSPPADDRVQVAVSQHRHAEGQSEVGLPETKRFKSDASERSTYSCSSIPCVLEETKVEAEEDHTSSVDGSERYESHVTTGKPVFKKDFLVPSPEKEPPEPLVQVKVAKWWRRQKCNLNVKSLPISNNPNTILFSVASLPQCCEFLQDEKNSLLMRIRQSRSKKADLYASLASVEDWQGNVSSALRNITKAVELDPTNAEYEWLKIKLMRQHHVLKVQEEKSKILPQQNELCFPNPVEVDRVSAKCLSQRAFLEQYVDKRKPVILLDVVSQMTEEPWTLDHIKSKAEKTKVTVKQAVLGSVEWAKLEESRTTTVGEFISEVTDGLTNDYLFDWSLPLYCPQLADDISLPKYFSNNFLQETVPGSLYKDSWPSLFISPAGAVSDLHVDAFASNFWMALFQGEKRWTFFDPDDTPLLYPRYVHSMDPVFTVDLAKSNMKSYPLVALTSPRQCILKPGELLFVPGGSPHYVENLTTSLAVSSNHVDSSNFKEVCCELKVNGLVDPRADDLLKQFQQPEFQKRVGCPL